MELRQFPHNFCRFNLSEQELHETILDAWAQGQWIEVGERKWSPHQANLVVLDGPRLPVEQLSMGRGWRNALRQGQDVTDTLLDAARTRQSAARGLDAGGVAPLPDAFLPGERHIVDDPAPRVDQSSDKRLAADSLGLDVLTKLGEGPAPVMLAWQLATERYPEYSASDALRLAEDAVRSLALSGLVVVLSQTGSEELEPCEPDEQLERVLRKAGSWVSDGSSPRILLSRR